MGLTDSKGNLVNAYVYDPFGNSYEKTAAVANPWQYAGGYLDSSATGTGLYKMGTRYYDPTLGRWTQEDPAEPTLVSPDSLNRYLYVDDSPVNFTDPSGKDFWSCFWIGFAFGLALWGLWASIVGIVGTIFAPPPFDAFSFFIVLVGLLASFAGAVLLYNDVRSCASFLNLPAIPWLP